MAFILLILAILPAILLIVYVVKRVMFYIRMSKKAYKREIRTILRKAVVKDVFLIAIIGLAIYLAKYVIIVIIAYVMIIWMTTKDRYVYDYYGD